MCSASRYLSLSIAGCSFVITQAVVIFLMSDSCFGRGSSLARVVPSDVSLFLAFPNVNATKERLLGSAWGQFASTFSQGGFSSPSERFSRVLNLAVRSTGLFWDELRDLPSGELAYVVRSFGGNAEQCVILEAKEQLPGVELLLQTRETVLARNGYRVQKLEVGSFNLVAWTSSNDGVAKCFCYFIAGDFAVIGDGFELVHSVATRWSLTSSGDRLADDPEFQKEKRNSSSSADLEVWMRPKEYLTKATITALSSLDVLLLLPLMEKHCVALYAEISIDALGKDTSLKVGVHVEDAKLFVTRQGDAIKLLGDPSPYATADAVAVSCVDFSHWTLKDQRRRQSYPSGYLDKRKREIEEFSKNVPSDRPDLLERLKSYEASPIERIYSTTLQPQLVSAQYPGNEYVVAVRLVDREKAQKTLLPVLVKGRNDRFYTNSDQTIGNEVVYMSTMLGSLSHITHVFGLKDENLLYASSPVFWEDSSAQPITEESSFKLIKGELVRMAGTRRAIVAQYFDFSRMLEGFAKPPMDRLLVGRLASYLINEPERFLNSLSKSVGLGGAILTVDENVFRYELFARTPD